MLIEAAITGQGFRLTPELVSRLVQTETPQQIAGLLGLDRRGRTLARDKALGDAVALLGGAGDTWATAGRLAAAIARFEDGQWRHIRTGWQPAESTPLDEALRWVFASGASVPKTQRRLWDWLRIRY